MEYEEKVGPFLQRDEEEVRRESIIERKIDDVHGQNQRSVRKQEDGEHQAQIQDHLPKDEGTQNHLLEISLGLLSEEENEVNQNLVHLGGLHKVLAHLEENQEALKRKQQLTKKLQIKILNQSHIHQNHTPDQNLPEARVNPNHQLEEALLVEDLVPHEGDHLCHDRKNAQDLLEEDHLPEGSHDLHQGDAPGHLSEEIALVGVLLRNQSQEVQSAKDQSQEVQFIRGQSLGVQFVGGPEVLEEDLVVQSEGGVAQGLLYVGGLVAQYDVDVSGQALGTEEGDQAHAAGEKIVGRVKNLARVQRVDRKTSEYLNIIHTCIIYYLIIFSYM